MITDNLSIVHSVANRAIRAGWLRLAEAEDARQECSLALCQAAQKYEPTRKMKFSTFATWKVKNRLRTFMRNRPKYAIGLYAEPAAKQPQAVSKEGLLRLIELTPMTTKQRLVMTTTVSHSRSDTAKLLHLSRARVDKVYRDITPKLAETVKREGLVVEDFV